MSVTAIIQPRRILVRGVNWLGDAVIVTTPALLRLREKFPATHIALLAPEKLKGLWLNHPAVNEIISIAPGESVFAIAKKLRRWDETPGEPGWAGQTQRRRLAETLAPANSTLRWCCRTHRVRRWKFFWPAFHAASVMPGRGGILLPDANRRATRWCG